MGYRQNKKKTEEQREYNAITANKGERQTYLSKVCKNNEQDSSNEQEAPYSLIQMNMAIDGLIIIAQRKIGDNG